jgi:hypothetical protein
LNFIDFNSFLNIMSRAQENATGYTYSTVPAGYQSKVNDYAATTSAYTPAVGGTTSNLYAAQPTYYTSQQQAYSGPAATNAGYATQGGQTYATQGGQTYATQGGQTYATQGGQTYAVQGGQTYAVQGGQTYASGAGYSGSGVQQKAVAEEIPV